MGSLTAIVGGILVYDDAKQKVCEYAPQHFEPLNIEARLKTIWVDVTGAEIRRQFGTPLLIRKHAGQDVWFYRTTNAYVLLSFPGDDYVSQFVIAVPRDTLRDFIGYKLPDEEVYGDFTLGRSTFEYLEDQSDRLVEAWLGPRTGEVSAYLTPEVPASVARGLTLHGVEVKAFDSHGYGRTMFGDLVLDVDLYRSFDCMQRCTKKDLENRRQVLKSVPGWLWVAKSGVRPHHEEWVVEQFMLMRISKYDFGGWFAEYCARASKSGG